MHEWEESTSSERSRKRQSPEPWDADASDSEPCPLVDESDSDTDDVISDHDFLPRDSGDTGQRPVLDDCTTDLNNYKKCTITTTNIRGRKHKIDLVNKRSDYITGFTGMT